MSEMSGKDPLVGTRIREYEIITKLGEGGMGDVYKAFHTILKEDRALKVMRRELLGDESFVARFMYEAKNLIKVNHTNVARFFEFFQHDDGTLFMAMEYVDGERLDDRLLIRGPLQEQDVLYIMRQVCSGIAEAHRQGIIHRDISPDNIMLVDKGAREAVKILDFGISKNPTDRGRTQIRTQVGTFIGKYRYSSPEQAEGEREELLDTRSDIYSLGVVMYEMLTGKSPFEASTPQAYLFKQMSEEPIPLLERTSGVSCSPDLIALIHKMLEKDRDKRVQSLEDVISGLREASGSMPLPAVDKEAVTKVETAAAPYDGPTVVMTDFPLDGKTVVEAEETPPEQTPPEKLSLFKNYRNHLGLIITALILIPAMVFMIDTFSPISMSNSAVIQINSRPSGASIYIDEALQAEKTPCMIEDIKAGKTHRLKVVKKEFEPWTQEFKLEKGAVKAFSIHLVEQ